MESDCPKSNTLVTDQDRQILAIVRLLRSQHCFRIWWVQEYLNQICGYDLDWFDASALLKDLKDRGLLSPSKRSDLFPPEQQK